MKENNDNPTKFNQEVLKNADFYKRKIWSETYA